MQKRRGSKAITEDMFEQLKLLINAKLSARQIIDITGYSRATLSRISSVDSFAAYKELVATLNGRGKERPYATPDANDPRDKVLQDVADSLNNLALSFNAFSDKLDEVLETKRPWMAKLKG